MRTLTLPPRLPVRPASQPPCEQSMMVWAFSQRFYTDKWVAGVARAGLLPWGHAWVG
jgi:hypothetical protein